MNKNAKIVIVSAGLIALGIYFFYKQIKQTVSTPALEKPKDTSAKTDWNKILKKGATGDEVILLQKALKQLTVSGTFDSLTEARLQKVMKVTQTSLNDYNKFINKK